MTTRRPAHLILVAAVSLGALAGIWITAAGESDENRIASVREAGSVVMPFELDKTEHIFDPNGTGGTQRVIVRDRDDADQITLIQTHLQQIAGEFGHGDFHQVSQIHGRGMPGLSELYADPTKYRIEYSALADGGELRYISDDAVTIEALHRWFNAQLADHGTDATAVTAWNTDLSDMTVEMWIERHPGEPVPTVLIPRK